LDKNSALIIISSSGNTPLFERVAELAKKKGALVVVLTDNPDAKLNLLADSIVIGPGGIDPLVSKTRGFGTALIRGFMLIALISDLLLKRNISEAVYSLPGISEKSLSDNENNIREIVNKWGNISKYLSAGIGPNVWTAHETALTMMKTNGMPSLGFEIEEFCHGPELTLNSDTGVFLYQSNGVGIEKTIIAAKAVIAAGAKLAVITNNQDAEWPNEAAIITVQKSEDLFSPLIMILPAQLFIYYTALKLGRNPDIGGIVDNPKISEVIKVLHS
jgi:glucosamine--fructose-6-phosphate aminotransferase (isomerizing)